MIGDIASHLKANRFGHNLEKAIAYYAFLGDMPHLIDETLPVIENIRSIFSQPKVADTLECAFFIDDTDITPDDVNHLLMLLSKGDRRYKGTIHRGFERFNIPPHKSKKILSKLIEQNLLIVEPTQEIPLINDKHHKLKKSMRHYFIDDKLKFSSPFMRFFFIPLFLSICQP